MSEAQKVFVFGASGHAKVVLDILARAGASVTAVFDDDPARAGQLVLGHRVAGGREALARLGAAAGRGIVAIGANGARRAVAQWLAAQGFSFASARHPAAVLGAGVRLGEGTALMAGAIVNADTTVGMHCIVNTGASIDHDCRVGDGVHIAPGATLCGGVLVGDGAFIGAGATVVPGRQIGSGAIIGAGAVVLHDVPDRALVSGNPARRHEDDEPRSRSD